MLPVRRGSQVAAVYRQAGSRYLKQKAQRWSRGGVAPSPLVEPDMQISRIRLAHELFHR